MQLISRCRSPEPQIVRNATSHVELSRKLFAMTLKLMQADNGQLFATPLTGGENNPVVLH